MLKVRIIALIIAILLTIATAYAIPWIVHLYKNWVEQMTAEQQQWFNIAQAVLGLSIAICAFWFWKKKKSSQK
jgi:hypothetical protein